jgi:hypothetical protein
LSLSELKDEKDEKRSDERSTIFLLRLRTRMLLSLILISVVLVEKEANLTMIPTRRTKKRMVMITYEKILPSNEAKNIFQKSFMAYLIFGDKLND